MKKKTLKNNGWSALNVPFVERQTQLFKKRIETTVHCLLSQRSMAVWKAFQRILDGHSKEHQMLKLSEMVRFKRRHVHTSSGCNLDLFAMNERTIRIHPHLSQEMKIHHSWATLRSIFLIWSGNLWFPFFKFNKLMHWYVHCLIFWKDSCNIWSCKIVLPGALLSWWCHLQL